MSKEELLNQLEEKGLYFDTRALIVDDVLDIVNQQLAELKAEVKKWKDKCNELIDNANEDADNYTELDWENRQLKTENERLKENQTPTDEELLPQNYDDYNIADKLRYKESQVREALKMSNENYETIIGLEFELQKTQQQLKEKDELQKATDESLYASRELYEIEKTKRWELEKQLKSNTHQVCEKIRELAKNDFEFIVCDECYNTVDKDVYISSMALTEILDQIEKGGNDD